MLTSLSNALQMPIIVFSSIACHPLFFVTPETQTIPVPLMVAFTQFGAGHYDGVIPKDTLTPSVNYSTKATTCSCGRNDSSGHTHCHEIQYKYTTGLRCV